MSKRQRSKMYLLLGVAAGVAAGFYLNSKNGKKIRKRAAKGIEELSEEVNNRIEGIDKDLSTYKSEAEDKVNGVRARLADVMSPTEN